MLQPQFCRRVSRARYPEISRGYVGRPVKRLQDWLRQLKYMDVTETQPGYGHFGPITADAVEQYQRDRGLTPDSIVGPDTWMEIWTDLGIEVTDATDTDPADPSVTHHWERVLLPNTNGRGYDKFTLRDDAAAMLRPAVQGIAGSGGVVLSSGGKRYLEQKAGRNRSATSLHYLGLAFDLWLYGGVQDIAFDPYVIERDDTDGRFWRVYCRVPAGVVEPRTVYAMQQTGVSRRTQGCFLDLTQRFADAGFQRIESRADAWGTPSHNYGGTEWWHFEARDLIPIGATFGDMLLKLYSPAQLRGTAPWKQRKREWDGKRFR